MAIGRILKVEPKDSADRHFISILLNRRFMSPLQRVTLPRIVFIVAR
ncbi:hypothetical protein SAMN05216409_11399 [Pseudomonas lutea]|uniref:Uncharacterized protein n=1 Tax=Pseudomonas lutea TaxID=243924 RepID=A0A9X8MFZ0_9PSED|nr:hypothetical protein SAMN05216409_11399 [Pseudomonas lutea]